MSRQEALSAPTVPRRRSPRLRLGRRVPLGRTRAGQLAILLAVLASLGAGYLGMRIDREAGAPAAVGEVLSAPDAELRVDAVRFWNESQHSKGMPGMPIPDPLPEGYRRFWTDVTIHSTGGAGFAYEPTAFTVSGEGLQAIAPHWASDGLDRVIPGAQATVTFLFQVPEELDDVLLQLPGTTESVLLPGPDGSTDGHHAG
jgi:hypothetical protein